MRIIFSLLSLLISFALPLIGQAQVSEDVRENIQQAFKKSLPSLEIDKIQQGPIEHLYEVTSGPVIMYATKDGKYAISGDILDLSDGETNLTEQARKAARLSALEQLGEENMVVFPAKSPRYEVTVFTDLDCVYCRKFHSQIKDVNNRGITVRYVAFPRAGEKSTSFEKAVHVWCAQEPAKMLTKAKQGQPIPAETCEDHKIKEQFHLGVMAGISGTPSMILDDGTLVAGYYNSENLLTILESVHKDKKINAIKPQD